MVAFFPHFLPVRPLSFFVPLFVHVQGQSQVHLPPAKKSSFWLFSPFLFFCLFTELLSFPARIIERFS